MANVFNITGTAAEIVAVMPDIVTLQEVDNTTERHPIDEVAFLSAHTGLKHSAYAPWRPFEGGQYGIAILSRYPLLQVERHGYVKPAHLGSSPQNCSVQRPMDFCQGILAVLIAPPAFPNGVWVITTHISVDGAQFEEAKQLVQWVSALLQSSNAKQAFVTGDFNEPPNGQGPSYIGKFWKDSFGQCYHNPQNPHGFTFNSQSPDRRIDYIWIASPSIPACKRAHTVSTQASDHLPYIGDWQVNIAFAH